MNINVNNRYTDSGLLIIRTGISVIFILLHGLPKMQGGPEMWLRIGKSMSNLGINFLPEFWGFMASFSEFIVPLFILTGLFFRPALLLISFTMIVALITHFTNTDPWSKIAYPMALLTVFTGLFLTGPGRFSLDHMLRNNKYSNK